MLVRTIVSASILFAVSLTAIAAKAGERTITNDELLRNISLLTGNGTSATFKGTDWVTRQECKFSVTVDNKYVNLSVTSAGKTLSRVVSPGEKIKISVEDNESFPGVMNANYLFPNGDYFTIGEDAGTGTPFELSLKTNRKVISCSLQK